MSLIVSVMQDGWKWNQDWSIAGVVENDTTRNSRRLGNSPWSPSGILLTYSLILSEQPAPPALRRIKKFPKGLPSRYVRRDGIKHKVLNTTESHVPRTPSQYIVTPELSRVGNLREFSSGSSRVART